MAKIDVELLTRLDLKPGEVLGITLGIDLTPLQMREVQDYVAARLAEHGLPGAVVVLPKGCQLTALRAAEAEGLRLPEACRPQAINAVGNECCAERGPCGCPPLNPM
jgi:hypothetical protein